MQRTLNALVAVLVVVTSPAYAAVHIVDIAWDQGAQFAHSASVEPGKFVEVCGKLDPGQAIRWEFSASTPVDFNIHYHLGKETQFPAKQAQVNSGRDVLRVAVREDYCWMWTNKSPGPAQIDVRLQR